MVPYLTHFGHRIGRGDQFLWCIASGQNDLETGRLGAYERQHTLERYQPEGDGDIDLVQDQHIERLVPHQLFRPLPPFRGKLDIHRRGILRIDEFVPSVLLYCQSREVIGRGKLTVQPSLHELDHNDPHSVTGGPDGLPEGGGRLSLSISGVELNRSTLERHSVSYLSDNTCGM